MRLLEQLRSDIVRSLWFTPDRLTASQIDRVPDWAWTAYGWITDVTARACCLIVGHEPVCDQCCQPEHDFCVWCKTLTPGQARHPERTTT